MDFPESTPRTSVSPSRDHNPRKRGRTACTRCKTRKQKCDNDYPVCSNCHRAGAVCDKASVRQDTAPQNEYTHALEQRIKDLESQLSSKPLGANGNAPNVAPAETPPLFPARNPESAQPGLSPATGIDHNAVGELVGFLALNSYEAPAYVGSSSGLSLAANLGEMVQATVWNQVLTPSRGQQNPLHLSEGVSGGGASTNGPRGVGGQPRSLRMEDLIAKSTEPPNDEMGARILQAYLTRLHVRYTFLDRRELWRLHEDRFRLAKMKREELSQAERFGLFKLYLVYAIGATTLDLSEKYTYVPPERFYMTALQQVPTMCEARSIENIEAMTLLVVYHLRSASSQGVWYMVGLAMRTAIDLGLHRKANESNLDPITAQMRRRLFWTVYYLERVVSMSLGRPFSIADRHIDLPLPLDADDDVRDPALLSTSSSNTSPAPPNRNTTLTFSIYLIQLRRIDSKIQHKIYRADRPLHSLRSKMNSLFLELEQWKESALLRFHGPDLDYPMLHYNRALRLLIQPFLPSLPLTDPYYHVCLRAAGNICQTHKRLHQTLEYGHSFLAVQTVFMAGITLLYALWTHAHDVWSVQMSNDIRACSTVLFVMGERAVWVKKYRDAFELLVNAAMEKLEVNDPSRKIGMAELMTAQHLGDLSNANPYLSSSPTPGLFKHPYPNLNSTSASSSAPNPTTLVPPPSSSSNINLNPNLNPNSNPNSGIAADINHQQQHNSNPNFNSINPNPSNTANPTDTQNHGMRMAFQLAPWIDLEEDSPFWMPDFETLENLSGNLDFWSAGAPGPFEP